VFHLLDFILLYPRHDNHWVLAGLGIIVGLAIFHRGFRLLQRKRLILDTPSSRVRSASMGLVEINGLATGPYTMTAPITGHACYYYRTTIWQLGAEGKKNNWDMVADECMCLPFYLDDNTGRLLVNPQGAEFDVHRDFHEEFDLSVPQRVTDFLIQHKLDTTRRVRVDEYCIKPKNALFVMGTLTENPGTKVTPTPVPVLTAPVFQSTFQMSGGRSVAMFRVSGSSDFRSLLRTNADFTPPSFGESTRSLPPEQKEQIAAAMKKAGITNPKAWQIVGINYPGTSAAVAAATALEPPEEFDLSPRTVLMKGTHNSTFIIAWRSQRQVVASLGWKAALMIWGGPALAIACSYFVLAHFGWL
jgi:E3 Ubiquitin ligase